jgi:two-component sensor histidine kinase
LFYFEFALCSLNGFGGDEQMQSIISDFSTPPASAEGDHRISNHLTLIASLLRMQKKALAEAGRFTRQDAEWLIDDCARRIETVGRVHRLLARQSDRHALIDIGEYLRPLAQGIVESTSGQGKYELELDCDPGCRIRSEDVASIGLIVGELVTNAVKYAHPAGVDGKIRLKVSISADNRAVIKVSDDGVGLPAHLDPATSGSVGFRMIRSLVQRLQGEIDYDSSCLGLSVTIRIPVSAKLFRIDNSSKAVTPKLGV